MISKIAMRGFRAGYMFKGAAPTLDESLDANSKGLDTSMGANGPATPSAPADAGVQEPDQQLGQGINAATPGAPDPTPAPPPPDLHPSQNYAKLGDMLKGVWPGAAAGAAGVGALAGILGRKKPGNMKRMLLWGTLMGIPAGVLAQLASTGVPGGSGMGGTAGLAEAGGIVGGAASDAATDVRTGTAWDQFKSMLAGAGTGGIKGAREAMANTPARPKSAA